MKRHKVNCMLNTQHTVTIHHNVVICGPKWCREEDGKKERNTLKHLERISWLLQTKQILAWLLIY